MESIITYEDIIMALAPKKKPVFESCKNIMNFSNNFPDKFKELFSEKFYRYGVQQKYENKNISFLSSFLTLLKDNFMILSDIDIMLQIKDLISMLCEKINKTNSSVYSSIYLKEISKQALRKIITDMDLNVWFLETLTNVFQINIIIYDFKTEDIYTIYPSNAMNVWKPTLLFAKYDNSIEPIMHQEKKIFSYNDNVIKKTLSSSLNIQYYDSSVINKQYNIINNIADIINIEFTENLQIKDIFIEQSNSESNILDILDNNKPTEEMLNKMTKPELLAYMKSHNIKSNSKSLKKVLIDQILNQI